MEMVLCIASPADRQCCEVGSNAGQSFMENGILAPELLRLHKLQSATTALFAHNYNVPLLLVHTVGLNITTTVYVSFTLVLCFCYVYVFVFVFIYGGGQASR